MSFKKFYIRTITMIMLASFIPNGWGKNGFSTITGKELMQWCTVALKQFQSQNTKKDVVTTAYNMASCAAFILATNDALFLQAGISSGIFENKNASIKMPYCLPDKVGEEEFIKNVLEYIKENPETLDIHASIVVYSALKQHYPCN